MPDDNRCQQCGAVNTEEDRWLLVDFLRGTLRKVVFCSPECAAKFLQKQH